MYDVWRGTRPRPRPGGGVDGDRRLFEARACEFFSWTLSCSKEARGKQSRAPRFAAFGVISNESSVRFHPIRFWIFAQGPQQEQHCFCCAKSRFTITPWLGNHTGYDGSLKPLMKAGFSRLSLMCSREMDFVRTQEQRTIAKAPTCKTQRSRDTGRAFKFCDATTLGSPVTNSRLAFDSFENDGPENTNP